MSALTLGPAVMFTPADRPERYATALERADAVILDLEDAVTAADRPAAREAVAAAADVVGGGGRTGGVARNLGGLASGGATAAFSFSPMLRLTACRAWSATASLTARMIAAGSAPSPVPPISARYSAGSGSESAPPGMATSTAIAPPMTLSSRMISLRA